MKSSKTYRITRIAAVGIASTMLAAAGALMAAPTPAPNPKAAIAARQASYKKIGAAMKAINDQLKTDAPAKDVILASARVIAATAPGQASLFPAGSGPTAGVKTDALPNIWTDRATFDGMMRKMIAESARLATVAGSGNLDAIRAQAKVTGGTCGSCHRQFRADD